MRIHLVLLLLLLFNTTSAQSEFCATADHMLGSSVDNSEHQRYKSLIEQIGSYKTSSEEVIVIPTVVHIFHDGISGNISDSQVIDGMRVVNEDFRRFNADTNLTNPIFKPFAADVGIEFRLAQLDPQGNPTNGITRTDTNLIPAAEPDELEFNNVKHVTHWPAGKYFNIWVVRGIRGGSAGYAQYPGTDFTYGGPWSTYGAVVRANAFGTIESASGADGRTVTHELGHCLGLYHTFLSASTGCETVCDTTGDEVCDTPPSEQDFTCDANLNGCSNDMLGNSPFSSDVIDQKENYMSYNSCQNMFSLGQKERMLGFFNFFDTLRNLATELNLIETGLLRYQVGVPSDDFNTQMKLYPNPCSDYVQIELETRALKNFQLVIYSVDGKLVDTEQISSQSNRIDLQDWTRGIYWLEIESGSTRIIKKLIVSD